MDSIETLFRRLIEKTEVLILILKPSLQSDDFTDVDHLFEEREKLLLQLREKLKDISKLEKYRHLYQSWKDKEAELKDLVNISLQVLAGKINEAKQSRSVSNQYDSYLQQMPYGAFLDKKR